MSEDTSEVDLDVSGPTATAIAGSILSICEEADDPGDISVTLTIGESTISLAGDGTEAVAVVPQMVSAVDWSECGLDAISVHLSSATDDDSTDFEPPDDPSDGDRITAWESADGPIKPVQKGTRRRLLLEALRDHGPLMAEDVAERTNYTPAHASSALSKLYSESGLLDRAQVFKPGGGLKYLYRLNDHGRAVVSK